MSEGSLRRRLLWMIAGRAAVITLVLGSAILIQLRAPGSFPIDPFFALIGLTYGLTVVWALTLRFVDRHRWLIDVQVACDALIVSAIVHLTGGVASYLSSLYTLPIIAASTVQSWRGGLMVSLLSMLLYAALVIAQYQGAPLPLIVLQSLPPARVAIFTVALNVFGFMAVAGLSGYLAEGLRRADAQLEEASTQLADLQAFSQHVIDSMISGLATCDMQGRVMSFNKAAETITGVASSQALWRPMIEVLQLPDIYHPLFVEGGERPAQRRREYGFHRADGRDIEMGISSAPLITPRGESGFLFTFQDVTELKKQERAARMQQRLAEVGEMAAGKAPEIHNPVASMAGSIQILRDELPLTPDQSQLMDIVLRESDRLNTTIGSFLAYARPQRFQIARFDVRRALNDAALLLRNSAEVRDGHEILVDVPPTELWYEADEGQIKQIVWNLATNGLRSMADGGRLKLTALCEPSSDGVVVTVQDQGVGIAAEELDSLFQPFHGSFAKGSGL